MIFQLEEFPLFANQISTCKKIIGKLMIISMQKEFFNVRCHYHYLAAFRSLSKDIMFPLSIGGLLELMLQQQLLLQTAASRTVIIFSMQCYRRATEDTDKRNMNKPMRLQEVAYSCVPHHTHRWQAARRKAPAQRSRCRRTSPLRCRPAPGVGEAQQPCRQRRSEERCAPKDHERRKMTSMMGNLSAKRFTRAVHWRTCVLRCASQTVRATPCQCWVQYRSRVPPKPCSGAWAMALGLCSCCWLSAC